MKKKSILMAGAVIALAVFIGCNANNGQPGQNPASEVVSEAVSPQETGNSEVISSEEVLTETDSQDKDSEKPENALEDGLYYADFDTDNSMFHVNEACDGKGLLTVKDGEMSIHVSLTSKNIVNLYYGLAEDAMKDGAELLQPTTDEVTYSDGMTEEVNGFDIPVPYLDEEFDVALIGKKEKWYDHKVSVSNPVPADIKGEESGTATEEASKEDWDKTIDVTLEGGSGKATITSPAKVRTIDGGYVLIVEWSSPNYDYMIFNGEKLLPVNTDGNSVFEIPIGSFDKPLEVIADTVAMSKPHEIEYTIYFDKESLRDE